MPTIRILAMVMKFTFQQESGLKSHFGFSRFRSNFLSIPGILTRGEVMFHGLDDTFAIAVSRHLRRFSERLAKYEIASKIRIS